MKKRLLVWTFGLMIITMALQISLMKIASNAEPFHEVLIAKEPVYPNETITESTFAILRIAESNVEPWMVKAGELSLPAWPSRLIKEGALLNRNDLSAEPGNDFAEVALRLEPQDAVAYQLMVGEAIDLLGIRGEDSAVHFTTMKISAILGQDLAPVGVSAPQPVYLILRGEKKEILELCRIKSTHTFQVIKRKTQQQKEG